MKALEVYYQELISTGDYSNKTVGIRLAVEDGEKAKEVLEIAKKWVDRKIRGNGYTTTGHSTLMLQFRQMESRLDLVRAERDLIAYKMQECPSELHHILASKMGELDSWIHCNSQKAVETQSLIDQIEDNDIPF